MDEEVRDYLTGDLETFGALPDLGTLVLAPKASSATVRAAPTEVVSQDVKVTAATTLAPTSGSVVQSPVRATTATEVGPSTGVVRQTPTAASSSSFVAAPTGVVRETPRLTSSSTVAPTSGTVRREAPAYTAASTVAAPTSTATGGGKQPPPSAPLIPEVVYGPPPGRVIDAKLVMGAAPAPSPMPWLLLAALAGGLYWLAKSETKKTPSMRDLFDDDDSDNDDVEDDDNE